MSAADGGLSDDEFQAMYINNFQNELDDFLSYADQNMRTMQEIEDGILAKKEAVTRGEVVEDERCSPDHLSQKQEDAEMDDVEGNRQDEVSMGGGIMDEKMSEVIDMTKHTEDEKNDEDYLMSSGADIPEAIPDVRLDTDCSHQPGMAHLSDGIPTQLEVQPAYLMEQDDIHGSKAMQDSGNATSTQDVDVLETMPETILPESDDLDGNVIVGDDNVNPANPLETLEKDLESEEHSIEDGLSPPIGCSKKFPALDNIDGVLLSPTDDRILDMYDDAGTTGQKLVVEPGHVGSEYDDFNEEGIKHSAAPVAYQTDTVRYVPRPPYPMESISEEKMELVPPYEDEPELECRMVVAGNHVGSVTQTSKITNPEGSTTSGLLLGKQISPIEEDVEPTSSTSNISTPSETPLVEQQTHNIDNDISVRSLSFENVSDSSDKYQQQAEEPPTERVCDGAEKSDDDDDDDNCNIHNASLEEYRPAYSYRHTVVGRLSPQGSTTEPTQIEEVPYTTSEPDSKDETDVTGQYVARKDMPDGMILSVATPDNTQYLDEEQPLDDNKSDVIVDKAFENVDEHMLDHASDKPSDCMDNNQESCDAKVMMIEDIQNTTCSSMSEGSVCDDDTGSIDQQIVEQDHVGGDGAAEQHHVTGSDDDEDDVPAHSDVVRETREKEQVHFTAMSSVRSMFEQKGSTAPAPAPASQQHKRTTATAASKPATYHEPEERDGEAVIQKDSADATQELPPAGMSRSLVAKFSQYESSPPAPAPANNRPSSVSRSHSGARHTGYVDPTYESAQRDRARQSQTPDSGISEEAPAAAGGGDQLPEQGTTRSLVAQWRTKEQGVAPTPQAQQASRQRSMSRDRPAPTSAPITPSSPAPQTYSSRGADSEGERDYEEDYEDRAIVRSNSDRTEMKEDELPPPAFTKNLLAKFQNLQAEAQRDVQKAPPKKSDANTDKQFKWQVKEARPLLGKTHQSPTSPAPASSADTVSSSHNDDERVHSNGIDHAHQHDSEHESDREDEGMEAGAGPGAGEEELPPQQITKNLLAKFRSLEDTTKAPPSPQHAAQQRKALNTSTTARTHHGYTSSAQREQPDGGDESQVYQDSYGSSHNHQHHDYSDEEDMEHDDRDVMGSNTQQQELPEQGTTRGLLAKFQAMQS